MKGWWKAIQAKSAISVVLTSYCFVYPAPAVVTYPLLNFLGFLLFYLCFCLFTVLFSLFHLSQFGVSGFAFSFKWVDRRIIWEQRETASKLHGNGPGVIVPLVSIRFFPTHVQWCWRRFNDPSGGCGGGVFRQPIIRYWRFIMAQCSLQSPCLYMPGAS